MRQKLLVFIFVLCCIQKVNAQKDSTSALTDTSFNYDDLFSELDTFFDSLLTPRSYTLINVSAGSSVFNYSSETSYYLEANKKLVLNPSIGYFDKSGLGINAAASVINDKKGFNAYQYAVSLSYDYLKNLNFLTGVSATRFITKDSLPFYTSPLKNEVSTYFSYRKLWVKPAVSVNFGWGSKKGYTENEEYITSLRLRSKGYTRVNTQESITDFNIMLSLRHDFYWLNVLSKKDFIRLTPQVSFTSGTQSFGFNQTANTYGTQRFTGSSELYRSKNVSLSDQTNFQAISAAFVLKSELSVGKFFIQPQLVFNYYIPATENNLTTLLVANAGFIF